MKKLLAVLISLAMLACVLPAAMADEEPIHIKFWHTRGSGANYEVVQHSVNTFNETIGKEKGIVVEEVYSGSYNDILPATQLAIQSGESPQVVVSGNTFVNYLLEDGVLADMAPLAKSTGWDTANLLQPFQEIKGNTDGTLYSLPYVRSTPLFNYNKTMADAKGLTAPTTVDEMVEFCRALWQKDGENTSVYGLCILNDFGYIQAANLYQMGSAYLNEEGNACPALDDGAMLKVLGDWRAWVDEGWCSPFDATNAGAMATEMFAQQRLACLVYSSGGLSTMTKNAADNGFELGVAQYPTYDADKRIAEIGGGNICIIAEGNTDEQIAASWEFVQYLMSDEMVTYNTTMTGYVPTTYSVANYEGMQKFWEENPLFKVAYDQVTTGRCQENPYSEYLQDFTQCCWDAVSLLIQDQSITAEEAVEHIRTNSAQFFNK